MMGASMSFATVICCMDGRIQLPVIEYLQERFKADYIDNITAAGPVGVISASPDSDKSRSMIRMIDISISLHGSEQLAIVAHHDCAGNPIPGSAQRSQIEICKQFLAQLYPDLEIIGLWLDEEWQVHES